MCGLCERALMQPCYPYTQVKPYYFDFKCHVKQRWENQNIVDLFTTVRGGEGKADMVSV